MFVTAMGVLGLVIGAILRLISESVPDHNGGGRPLRTCRSCGADQPLTVAVPVLGAFHTCGRCNEHPQRARVILEISTSAVFAFLAWRVGQEWSLVPLLILAAALLALSAVDLERFRLPDRLLFPSLGLAALSLVVLSSLGGWTGHLVPAFVGMLIYGVLLFIPNLIAPAMLGFGDVKLALLLGLFLGWARSTVVEGFALIIWALLIGFLCGILSGMLVGVGRRIFGPTFLEDPDYPLEEGEDPPSILRTAVPMGPGLALGAFVVLIYSTTIVGGQSLF
jgi:leader peptidase (prepilin peptidase)/N-methyltransferase